MKKIRRPSHLRLLFIGAVIVPCLVLGIIAIRSVNREEAFVAMRLERTIDAELVYTVSRMNAELDLIQEELASSIPSDAVLAPETAFNAWKASSELVLVPFSLSPDLKILWPTLTGSLSENERSFLNWNREFITDQAAIPAYLNIALYFKDEITRSQESPEDTKKVAAEAKEMDDALTMAARDNETLGLRETPKPAKLDAKSKMEEAQAEQKALSEFEKSPDVRQLVYDQARAKGQKTEERNVMPSAGPFLEPQQSPKESIFISEPQRFSEITAGLDEGLIPRFIEEKLTLLFWKRDSSGGTIGCVIAEEALRGRLAALLPTVYTPARILAILDENGRPLLTTENQDQRDWRRPFVAREISERLPRWEVAAYLTNPDSVASQAGLTTLILWILIFFLFVAIVSGGTYVLSTLRSEMQLALQKTTFVANVSHELKTPLTSIRMFAEMLKERRQPDGEKREKYLNLMVSETERLTRLINNVLDFARSERGERKYEKRRLDAAWLAEELIEGQRVRLEHNGFRVVFRNDLGEAFVEGDEEALKQAILNLLSNAEKYSGEDKLIEVDITGTEDSLLIHVKDRGRGVPAGDAKKIFREFYRVDESLTARAGGSGLGLPIALRIIQDHGGDIHYFPRDGGGSVFQIRLPLKRQP